MEDGICPYEVLELEYTATDDEIKKAKRTLSRIYHPDKNRNASESEKERLRIKFDLIGKAVEFLSDATEKAKYDNILKARKATKIRHAKQDAERRAARDDLEKREKESQLERAAGRQFAAQQAEKIKQLRAESLQRMEQEQLRQKQEKIRRNHANQASTYTLKIKWSSKDDYYTPENLTTLFGKYGAIDNVIMRKAGSALVSFLRLTDAVSDIRRQTTHSSLLGDHVESTHCYCDFMLQKQAVLHERGTGDHALKKVELLQTDEPPAKEAKIEVTMVMDGDSMDLAAMEALMMQNLVARS
eukprot:TRINITY_DN10067_c0_g1_i2.p1 TRINITY_DN10067_c0_g1~~TRINITY_DN10067_c0_g1_i2.p1  ORF type:complete len:300 (+),score=57.02 TRINITY_DN10067_c0_g1_i2:95-994(+)